MKKLLLLLAVLGCSAVLYGAETAPAETKWKPFELGILPGIPGSMWRSNVYGIKTGWPVVCGYGKIYGIEGSWIYSGTRNVKGIQASWICCQSDEFDGIQASFVTCLNLGKQFNGLQATCGYVQSGDLNGAQGGAVSIAKNVKGLQAGLLLCVSKDVDGFQAAGVNINLGKLRGVQCSIYGQVADSSGLQLGAINVSGGKGFQFGAINIMKHGFLKVFPIFNFAW